MAQTVETVANNIMVELTPAALLGMHYRMLFIRRFEEKVNEQYTRGKIGGYCHVNIGEEASIVGAYAALTENDYVFASYRAHGHVIARGAEPRRVMAELFGKETGLSHGRGGSMHMFDRSHRFLGGWAIVGGHLPLAVGAGLAVKHRGGPEIVACFLGDGATNIGAFHESLNLAKLWRLPVLFVIVNNQYGMGTPVDKASAVPEQFKKAAAYGIMSERADGMDVVATYEAARRCAEHVRTNSDPYVLELITYRFRGHSTSDPGNYRTKEEVRKWMDGDPISLIEQRLEQASLVTRQALDEVDKQIEGEVEECVAFAGESPFPALSTLNDNVYDR